MRIAYLINRYPWPSHTFIRREIAALERAGVTVRRFSIRRVDARRDVVDPDDAAECGRTQSLLGCGAGALALATLHCGLRRPQSFLVALRAAVGMGRRSDRGVLRHLAYLAEACLLCRLLRRPDAAVDHVHAHFATNSAAVVMLCRLVGGPSYSFTIHGPEPFDKPALLALDRKVAHASFVAAISDYARAQLCRWCRREDWSKIHVVRCGVDDSFLNGSEPDEPPAQRRLVCVARLCEQKGLFVLIEAAQRLAQQGVAFQVDVLGDGPLRGELETAVRDAGLEGRVRLHGWVGAEEVRRQLLAARALVLPSFAEGLPIVLMEAMALHRPVIATAVGGIAELVQHGLHGWLLPPGNVDALAQAMKQALQLPHEGWMAYGRAGAAKVRERHNCEAEAGRLAALFRAAIGTSPQSS